MKKINWNPKAAQYLTPLQRDAVERGETPRRLEGKISTDADGNVWFGSGGHRKLLGDGGRATLADGAPASESSADRNLDAPTGKPSAKPRKPRAKRK